MILTRSTPLPVQDCCRLLGVSRASVYRIPQVKDIGPDILLEYLAGKYPRFGYRRLALKAGLTPKSARLRLKRLGLMVRLKTRRVRTTHPVPVDAQNLCHPVVMPGELLVSDFTYIPLPRGFAYLAVTIDVFSRRVRGWSMSQSMKTDFTAKALHQALKSGLLQDGWIHHSDRGSQYASQEFRNLVSASGGTSSFSSPASPQENASAESFFARFKDEEVRIQNYQSFQEAKAAAESFIHDYNNFRSHS
jgi:putative transposase